jgi:hypothetical protein
MRPVLVSCLALTLLLAGAGPGRAEDPLVDRVKKALDQGENYLRGKQRESDGSWEITPDKIAYPGGTTSLVLLALMNAGVPPSDPAIQKGLTYLRGVKSNKTYVVALQTMVFSQARQEKDLIRRNVQWLLDARLPTGWSYSRLTADGMGSVADNSNTQYALLGLHAAIEAGVEVDRRALAEVRKLFIDRQQKDGSWSYHFSQPGGARMTMTIAGLCNLMITGMDLAIGKQVIHPDGSVDHCGVYDENGPVNDALTWLGARFPPRIVPATVHRDLGSPFYCLYGLERAGRLTGRRFFGEHDWYEIGCRYLVETQDGEGFWRGGGGAFQHDQDPIISTSFALLFLAKGRTPVLLSKLAYGAAESTGWNNKRNDMRHLVEFASRELFKKQPLAWQVFDARLQTAETHEARRKLAADLLQSPVVFINGHDLERFNEREEEILKEYLENGGFLFAEACCGRQAFDRRFRALVKRISDGGELEPLEKEHPVWTASGKFAVPPNTPFRLEGLKQGCKTVIIYSPQQMAAYWEANDFKSPRGQLAFQLAANVIAYATGLEAPKPRLTQVEIPRDERRDSIRRGFLKVAQLRHDGDWKPAPKAMRNLMTEARKAGLDVVLETAAIHPSVKNVLDYYFFYLHGRGRFSEKKDDLKEFKFRLKTGGTLLADACCGSKAFDESFRQLMNEMWADEKLKLEPIPTTDELFGKELNGTAIDTVRCRRPRPDGKGVEPEYRVVPPALEGIKYNGRWVVIYSRYDIGCALERHKSSDCLGHDHDSAVRLGRAAVLYALKR